jgi:methyltransferase
VVNLLIMLAVLLLVFGFMLVEARRAARNERAQRANGGIEPGGDVYSLMQFAYPGVFLAMVIDGARRATPVAPEWFVIGATLFLTAKALKWWAITALGPCWTFRVIVVPGTLPVETGPYRFVRHPNYMAVIGEIVGVAAMTGARVFGPLALMVFAALMLRRIAVENRALNAILRRG